MVKLFNTGKKKIDIAKALGVQRSTVTKIIKNYQMYGCTTDATKSGRPRKTDQRTDRSIVKEAKNILL